MGMVALGRCGGELDPANHVGLRFTSTTLCCNTLRHHVDPACPWLHHPTPGQTPEDTFRCALSAEALSGHKCTSPECDVHGQVVNAVRTPSIVHAPDELIICAAAARQGTGLPLDQNICLPVDN